MSPEFLLTSLVVVLVPGTGVIYTLSVGLGQGGRASVAAAIGCTLGIVPHLAAAVLGLAALLHASALLYQSVKYIGVAYLLYLAWTTLRDKRGALSVGRASAASLRGVAVRGILVNILNPKLSLFFFAFLPQFVDPQARTAGLDMIGLGLVFMLMTLVVFIGYGQFAAFVRDRVVSNARIMAWMRYGFAGTFVALGGRLALADR